MSALRGVRGATTASANDPGAILAATSELLEQVVRLNGVETRDVAAVYFTVTDDLDAAFPAAAARELGWTDVPLMCAREMPVAGAPARCVRVLVLWNTERAQSEVRHVYLRGARSLRPEWGVDVG